MQLVRVIRNFHAEIFQDKTKTTVPCVSYFSGSELWFFKPDESHCQRIHAVVTQWAADCWRTKCGNGGIISAQRFMLFSLLLPTDNPQWSMHAALYNNSWISQRHSCALVSNKFLKDSKTEIRSDVGFKFRHFLCSQNGRNNISTECHWHIILCFFGQGQEKVLERDANQRRLAE